MPNIGGPSTGCMTCRQRKIGCDETRPVCDNCVRSSKACGGYRDAFDTIHKNESEAVIAKYGTSKYATKRRTDDESAAGTSASSLMARGRSRRAWDDSAHPGGIAVPRPPSHNEQFIEFFLHNFTCTGSPGTATNLFWVPSNFQDLLRNDAARQSVHCSGAMAVARLRRSDEYLRQAQRSYGLAVTSLNSYLRSGEHQNCQVAFLAVLLLGFYEVLASYDATCLHKWRTHLGGIGALFDTSERLLDTDHGVRMFLQTRSQVILHAIQTKTPVVSAFASSNVQTTKLPTEFVVSAAADMLLIRLCDIQAGIQRSGYSEGALRELQALDNDFVGWAKNVPRSWSFITRARQSRQNWWDTRYDVYPSAHAASAHNKVRAARIVIHDLIKASPDIVHTRLAVEAQQPTPEIRQLVTDICATIPSYYMPQSDVTQFRDDDKPLLGTTYWLFWVLEVCGSMGEAPAELNLWIRQCLERTHETTGIAVAQRAAGRLNAIALARYR